VNEIVDFSMPSSNIGCSYIAHICRGRGPELSCDRREPSYVYVDLGRTGPAQPTDNLSEQSSCGVGNTLQYGQTWNGGPFTVQSSEFAPTPMDITSQ